MANFMPCSNQNLGHGLAYAMHSQFRLSFNSLTNWSSERILIEKKHFAICSCQKIISKTSVFHPNAVPLPTIRSAWFHELMRAQVNFHSFIFCTTLFDVNLNFVYLSMISNLIFMCKNSDASIAKGRVLRINTMKNRFESRRGDE